MKDNFSIRCCELYRTNDPKTYNQITVYQHKTTNPQRREIHREYTVQALCECGNLVTEIQRFDINFKKIQTIRIKLEKLEDHLRRIEKTKQILSFKPPMKKEKPVLGYIPLTYGKASGDHKIRPIYLEPCNRPDNHTKPIEAPFSIQLQESYS